MKRARTVLALVLLLAIGPSCGKDKKNPVAPGPSPGPTVLGTPQAVLTRLRTSYENRDTLAYVSCFEADYQGASYDTSDTPGFQLGAFTLADEVAHIRALALNPNVTSVSLVLALPGSWTRTTVAGPGSETWAQITIYNPWVQIVEGQYVSEIAPNETFEFQFRPTTPAPTSPTDTLWGIVRWTEAP